jgi:DNA replication protein DnaC
LLQNEYNAFNRPRVPEDIAEPAARRYYKAIERSKSTDFVVVDDLAIRDVTDAFRADLHSVINHRVTNALPTVYTSNVPIKELSNVFGEERLADRVRDMTQDFHFEGESRRGKR